MAGEGRQTDRKRDGERERERTVEIIYTKS